MNTKDIEEIDLAIANLLFTGLSLEQMKKIPKWLLENVENNKTKFRATLTQHHEAEVERAVEERDNAWKKAIHVISPTEMYVNPDAIMRLTTPTKTDKQY